MTGIDGAPAHPLGRGIANVAVLAGVLTANSLAGSGALSGESIGLIANRYTSYFLPAGWVFGIWSLIYLWLTAFAVYQSLPGQRRNRVLGRIGWGWAVNGALNVAWVVTFAYSMFATALAVMVILLLNLIWMVDRTGYGRESVPLADRVFVAWPFTLYLAWISVALIANTFQYMNYLQWGGLGISGQVWSPVMMGVGATLAVVLMAKRGLWLFPLVFAWAFVGIADRHADVPLVAGTARGMTVVVLGALAVAAMLRLRGGVTLRG